VGRFLPFHIQLRYERERCGWSQADVASKIGSDPKTVARWEGGKSLPRPYHRQALCELFGKNAEAFGLVPEQKGIVPPTLEGMDQAPSPPPSDATSSPSVQAKTYQSIEGFPPPTNPRTIQQREKDVQTIYEKLLQADTTAVVLTGIGGVGKSTLAALVYRYALEQYQAGAGPFAARPLWLTVNESVTMMDLVGTLLETLGKPLPDLERLTPHGQVMTLFHTLNSGNDARLIVLDQFENVLDWQIGYALTERPGVGEWLDALNSQPCSCKLLLTSRPWPRGTHGYPPTYMHEYPVTGLGEAEGIELLRKQGVRTEQATDLQLQTAVARCDGHAFALTFLASLLSRNRSLNLSLLFENGLYEQMWDGDIAHNLLDYIYLRQLDDVQREVLFAFSIYREPVPLEATMALTDINAKDQKARLLSALRALLAQHLLQASGNGLYHLHKIVANYVREYYLHDEKEQALRNAHTRAASYYFAQPGVSNLPREQRKGINDARPLIEATWHLCQAELWQQAFDLMQQEGIYLDLRRWGGNATLLELYQLLLPLEKWHPSQAQEAEICDHLGRIYGTLGKKELALEYYERAMRIYRAVGNRQGEGRTLNHIASVQENLGRAALARELHGQALTIVRDIGDRKGEADSLSGFAWIAHSQGRQEEALSYYEQALRIYGEIGNRIGEADVLNGMGLIRQSLGEKKEALHLIEQAWRKRQEVRDRAGEGRTLNNLGLIYADLEQDVQAYECYKQSFVLRKETGDRNGEGVVLYNIGKLYFKQERYSLALACWLQAGRIFEEVRSTYQDATRKWIDALQKAVGDTEFIALRMEVEHQSPQVIEQKVLKDAYLS
jgi:tetratricopeptide (TPR) repeat protein/transcriptional regulator with XRE-family HTH domain